MAAHLYHAEANALDSVGANHGTLQSGVAFAPGQVGQAFNFDGVDDSVDLGPWFDLHDFSLSMWVNPGATQGEYANIIDNNHIYGINWTVQQDSSTTNRYILGGGSAAGDVYFSLTANTWQHLTLTRDAGGVKKAYIDGVLIDTKTDAALTYNGAQFLRLGRWGGGGRNWNGLMDEVGIYDHALSAAEVQAIFTAGAGADLQVTIGDSPDPVLVGDSVTYTVSVTNRGPADATGVVAVVHGPAGQAFNSVTIPLAGLASGDSRSLQLAFTPSAMGPFIATAAVTANEADPNLTNNSFTAITQVGPRATFGLAQAQYEVGEGEPFAVLTVRRTGDLASSGSVEFTTVNGTATQRGIQTGLTRIDDFKTTSGALFFRSHSNVATIRVPIGDDNTLEPDETFGVVLSNPSAGMALGAISSADVIIHDNDPAVQFAAASSERSETSPSFLNQIEVKLLTRSSQTVTVAYAVIGGSAIQGTDFTLPRIQTLTFRPGETRKFITLSLINDTLYEGDETAIIEMSSPTNAFLGTQARHSITIVDNDPKPPPLDPGPTTDTALAIDLATLPRQSYRQYLGKGDVDTYKVELGALERLALDVDPSTLFPGIPALPSSKMTILDENGQTLATIGASPEPETGLGTNNAAHLIQADGDGGTYFIQLSTTATGKSYGYSLGFHRIGVSEKVPSAETLNVSGPMYAWYNGSDTVGITGPTGYGFTLKGPWQQRITSFGRSVLKSQTLTLNGGDQFTLASPQGVELQLVANGKITVSTKAQRWGDTVGVVTTDSISIPASLTSQPLLDQLEEFFGATISLDALGSDWKITLGDKLGDQHHIAPLLKGVPYLRQKSPVTLNAKLGDYEYEYEVTDDPIEIVFDPADPMLYLRTAQLFNIKDPALGLSKHGLLEFTPTTNSELLAEDAATSIYGHIYVNGHVPFKIWVLPFDAEGESIYNLDADGDGLALAGLARSDDFLSGDFEDFPQAKDVLADIQAAHNGILKVKPEGEKYYEFELQMAVSSYVYDGPNETFWFSAQTGFDPFGGTPLEFLVPSTNDEIEGVIRDRDDFIIMLTGGSRLAGVGVNFTVTITQEQISAHVEGNLEWSANIDYGAGTVKGKAIATITADVVLIYDVPGSQYPHLSGSVSAAGKLKWSGKTLFDDSIDSLVRSRGFRFKFPKGVGNLDFDLF